MAGFFITRPIFAAVISIVIALIGAVYLTVLPIAQFPDFAPPVIQISATYTGAGAQEAADAVATPLEQEINGAQDLIYISSNTTNDGSVTVEATFKVGYDLNAAAADVLTRINRAQAQLPESVVNQGIQVRKTGRQLLGTVAIYPEEGAKYDQLFLSNYAETQVIKQLLRVEGIGNVNNYSNKRFAIRLWLDPTKMEALAVDPSAVLTAVSQQNVQVTAGSVGKPPQGSGTAFEFQLTSPARLSTPEQFENIILRANPDGSVVRVRDVGRVELGSEIYGTNAAFSGRPAAALGIFQSPGSNAVEVMNGVRAQMEEIAKRFPPGIRYEIASDRTAFVRVALEEVVITLGIAIVLVVVVTYAFLQSWRATLIPCIAIPVSILGTFAPMGLLGFSLNTLSLLGLVLAVGLVVDDAIVVVENAERHIEEGEAPADAARAALGEVVGPVIATTLVLLALFIPVAFIPGITGQLYNQFALTIAISVALSAVVSLTLTPALCALLLQPKASDEEHEQEKHGLLWRIRAPLRWFDRGLDRAGNGVVRAIAMLGRRVLLVGLCFVALVGVTGWLFLNRPTAFVPEEDQGYFFVNVELPEGASQERTLAVMRRVSERLRQEEQILNTSEVGGRSFIADATASFYGFLIPTLKPWGEREESSTEIIERLRRDFASDPDARIRLVNPAPLPGIGSRGGLTLQVEDRGNGERGAFRTVVDDFIRKLGDLPEVQSAFTTANEGVPQYFLDIDRDKAEQLGVNLQSLFDGLGIYVGSSLVNRFNRFGLVYQVYIQGEADARRRIEDLNRLTVLNSQGEPVQIGSLVKLRFVTGPTAVQHYNTYPSYEVSISPDPGSSSGAALRAVEELAQRELPPEYVVEWTETAYQQKEAGGFAPLIFALGVVLVFLVLAAQYESWMLPLVVILSVPLAVFGATLALTARGLSLDVFAQIGLLMLVGLAAKNAILIVAFAEDRVAEGEKAVKAAQDAAKLRLRPILMTSFAFILGTLPLAIASGAGANSRVSIGTTVVGGLLVATVLTLFVTPVFFVFAERLREWRRPREVEADKDSGPAPAPAE